MTRRSYGITVAALKLDNNLKLTKNNTWPSIKSDKKSNIIFQPFSFEVAFLFCPSFLNELSYKNVVGGTRSEI